MNKSSMVLLFTALLVTGTSVQTFGRTKTKTINVVPDNAKIIINGAEVATGYYELNIKNQDYILIKLSAPGYIDKTVRVYKADKSNTLTYRLDLDEAYSSSDVSSDLANRPMSVVVKDGMSSDEVWKRITYYTSDLFPNMEISDKSSGWLRSSWEIQSFVNVTIRTRIEIKEIPGQDDLRYKVTLRSEIARADCGLDDQCFRQWDRILKRYKQAIEDLLAALQ